jgi:hypothetical protein
VVAKRPLLVAIEGKREQKERRAISTNNPPISIDPLNPSNSTASAIAQRLLNNSAVGNIVPQVHHVVCREIKHLALVDPGCEMGAFPQSKLLHLGVRGAWK